MEHMFWKGPTGSEIYCDLDITTPLGLKTWDGAIQSVMTDQPFILRPVFVRTVLVDFGEISMRRLSLTLDPREVMDKNNLASLLENEERLRKRTATF